MATVSALFAGFEFTIFSIESLAVGEYSKLHVSSVAYVLAATASLCVNVFVVCLSALAAMLAVRIGARGARAGAAGYGASIARIARGVGEISREVALAFAENGAHGGAAAATEPTPEACAHAEATEAGHEVIAPPRTREGVRHRDRLLVREPERLLLGLDQAGGAVERAKVARERLRHHLGAARPSGRHDDALCRVHHVERNRDEIAVRARVVAVQILLFLFS